MSFKPVEPDDVFVGVDPSYTGFGIIVLNTKYEILYQKLLTTEKNLEIEDKLCQLREGFKIIPKIINLRMVYLEGPAFARNGNYALQMGALHYFFRVFLKERKTPFKVIAPTTLKKFVTGTGRAKKDLVLLNVYKKWGVTFDDHNLADAYSLARMAVEDFIRGK